MKNTRYRYSKCAVYLTLSMKSDYSQQAVDARVRDCHDRGDACVDDDEHTQDHEDFSVGSPG
jgi:hypothetical protein